MRKKLSIIYTLFALFLNVNAYASWNGEVSKPPQNGSGVYEVSTPAELAWIAANGSSASVLLLNDIDFGARWDASGNLLEGKAWTPIRIFSGKFDGGGYAIKGLYIRPTSAPLDDGGFGYLSGVGLFNHIRGYGVVIKNLGIEDSYINGSNFSDVGAIVGSAGSATITNCYNTSNVNGGIYAGGIAGYGIDATFSECYNSGNISGCMATGIVSYCGAVSKSFNTGNITGISSAGGIVGYAGKISDCYNAGTIQCYIETKATNCSDLTSIGGLIGSTIPSGSIRNSYNCGSLVTNLYNPNAGGLVGYLHTGITPYTPSITNSYYLQNSIVNKAYEGESGSTIFRKTASQLQSKETFSGWDFTNTWEIDPQKNNGFPILRKTSFYCVKPSELSVYNITTESATLSCENPGDANQWEIQYGIKGFRIGEGTTINTASLVSVYISELTAGTAYDLYVRAVCASDNKSSWSEKISFATAQIPATIPYETGFEDDTENNRWTLLCNNGTNKFVIGTSINNTHNGTKALYITNDGGVSNNYTNTITTYAGAYRTLNFDEAAIYSISYEWRANGESNYDLLRVFLVPENQNVGEWLLQQKYYDRLNPETQNPVIANANLQGNSNATPDGWIALDNGKLNGSLSWMRQVINVTIPTSGNYTILFFWKNDYIDGTNPPAAVDNISIHKCPVPTELSISGITSNNAILTWSENGQATKWEIQYDVSGFYIGTGITQNVTSDVAVLSNLTPNTCYDVYVRAICGENLESVWSYKTSFLTLTVPQIPATIPYQSDFENDIENSKWTLLNGFQTNKWHIGTATNNTYEGKKALYISNNNGTSNVYANTSTSYVYAYRTINFLETGQHNICFDWKAYGKNNGDLLRAFLVPESVMLTAGDANGMTESVNTTPSGWIALDGGSQLSLSSAWRNQATNITISTAGNYNLVFFWKNDNTGGANPPAAIDNVLITKCLPPSSLLNYQLTPQSTVLSWAENGQANQWEIQYGVNGFMLGAGTTINVSSRPATINGLTPNTTHDVYVRAVCNDGNKSGWSAKSTFSTPAAPQISATIPYKSDFEDDSENAKWMLLNGNQVNKWHFGTATNNTVNGTKALYISSNGGANNWYNSNVTSYVYAYRTIYFAETGGYNIRFDWRANGQNNYDLLRAFLVPANVTLVAGDANGMTEWINTTPSGWIALDGGKLQLSSTWRSLSTIVTISTIGNYNLVFFWKNDDFSYGDPPAAVDNIFVTQCLPPSSLSYSQLTSEGVVLTWAENGQANQWEIQYGVSGFTLGTGTTAVVTTNSTAITGLSLNTIYTAYVRLVCNEDEKSAWSSPISFKTTNASIPYQHSFEDDAENEQWVLLNGSQTNKWHIGTASNNTDGGTKSLYISNNGGTSNVYTLNYSTSYVFAYRTIPFSETGEYRINFDWKAYGEKDHDLLRVFLVPGNVTLTAGNANGISLNRIPSGWIALDGGQLNLYSTWNTKSTIFTISTTGNYNLVFFWENDNSFGINPPAAVDNIFITKCLPPSSLLCLNVMHESAVLTWTENRQAGQWEIQYGVNGFALGAGTFISVSENPVNITGLTPSTGYDVYVRAVCSESEQSEWSGKSSFTTTQIPAALPYENDFENEEENNKWILVNGSQTNKWHIGTATNNTIGGTKALYISNNNGTSNAYTISGATSYVYAYRTINFAEPGKYGINFEWKAYGENNYDILRAFLVPANITLTAGSANGMTGNTNTNPSGWIALDDGQLRLSSVWNTKSTIFTIATAGNYNLVFFWKNDNSSGTNPPAAVDNIFITKCPPPSLLSFYQITSESAVVTWTENGQAGQWEMQYGVNGFALGAETIINVSEKPVTITGLTPNTSYDVYVRTVCSESEQSKWLQASFTTSAMPQMPATLPYKIDFENDEESGKWTLINGSQTNQWHIGTETNNTSGGTKALYISNDNGTSNAYTISNATSYVYAYRTISFVETGDYSINFDWNATGENNLDVLRAFLVPESVTLTAGNANGMTGTTNTTPSGWMALDGGQLRLSSEWDTKSTVFTISATGNYNLVFFWKNDNMNGTNPPAAVDNINLQKISCPKTSLLSISGIGHQSVTLYWTERGEATQWEIQYGISGFTLGNGTVEMAYELPYTPSNLTPMSAYDIYVRAVCSESDQSEWSGKASFTTLAMPQIPATLPYEIDFENSEESNKWALWNGSQTNKWHIGTAANNTFGGTNALYISNDNGTSNAYTISGATSYVYAYRTIHFAATGDHSINFDWKSNGQNNYDVLRAFLVPENVTLIAGNANGMASSSNTTPSGWLALDGGQLSLSSEWNTKSTIFTISTTGNYNLLFFWKNDNSTGTNSPAAVDNIYVQKISCPKTSSPSISGIAPQNVTLSWTERGEATQWEIQYGISGFTLGNGTIEVTDESTYTISNLTPTSTYDVYVRAVCSESDQSTWSEKTSFTTLQIPATLPYETGFESDEENSQWTLVNGSQTNKWHIGTATNNTAEGTKALYISNDNGTSNAYTMSNATSYVYAFRTIHFAETGEYSINFDWKAYGENNYDLLRTFLVPASVTLTAGNANGMTGSTNTTPSGWIALDGGQLSLSSTWNTRSANFTISIAGNYNLVFFWKNDASGGTNPPATVDNIKINSTCPAPTALAINYITSESSILSWTNNSNVNQWKIQYGIAGFTIDNGTIITTDKLTETLDNLTPDTQYDIYVRAVCSETTQSAWSQKLSFKTDKPCLPPTELSIDNITTQSAVFSWTDSNNANHWEINYGITGFTDDNGIKITTNELTETLENLTPDTQYDVYVRALCSETTQSAWSQKLSFKTDKPCLPPTELTIDNITTQSAVISWTDSNAATQWEITYGITGFNVDNGIKITTNELTETLENLTPDTQYDIYVRAVCSETTQSAWSEKASFKTKMQTTIPPAALANSLKVYPNPVKAGESVTIETGSDFQEGVIEIYNSAGVFVAEYSGNNKQTVIKMPDVSGIYLVRIKLPDIETQIIKIIVE